jgi:large subunit ribosomal protein L30
MTNLEITQIKSGIGGRRNQRETLRSLGLRKIGQTVKRPDTPVVRGMVRTVAHLVSVELTDLPEIPASSNPPAAPEAIVVVTVKGKK